MFGGSSSSVKEPAVPVAPVAAAPTAVVDVPAEVPAATDPDDNNADMLKGDSQEPPTPAAPVAPIAVAPVAAAEVPAAVPEAPTAGVTDRQQVSLSYILINRRTSFLKH